MMDSLIEKFTHKERYKNGKIITSINNTRSYKEIKNSLTRFTQEVYNRSLSSYYFKEISERFLLDYTLYIQKVGIENGNKVRNSVVCVPLVGMLKNKVFMV